MKIRMSEFVCRKALPSDAPGKIAEYIHLTDPYIYPGICGDPSDPDWRDFIGACLESTSNIYCRENIVVLLHKEEIIGIACVIPCGKMLTITEGIVVPRKLEQKIETVKKGYFDPLIEESRTFDGYNIVNFCIDGRYQGRGLGKRLMAYCVELYGGEPMHLDVIAANAPAVALYEKFSFKKESLYMGFSGSETLLPCYHMTRTAVGQTKP